MLLFDTHTHVNFNAFKNDWREVIDWALKNNIWLVNVGSQSTTSKRAVEIAENYQQGVYAAVGLHPSHLFAQEVDELEADEKIHYKTRGEEFDENYYLELAKNEKVKAIGECGLDYYRSQGIQNAKIKNQNDNSKLKIIKEKQIETFIRHIELSHKINKPLIIHCRDAHDDLMIILKSYILNHKSINGVMHFFTGTLEQAKKYIEMGFYISFSGVITFQRSKTTNTSESTNYNELIKNLPLDKILIETDSPYVAPAPYRGKRNEPSYVIEIAKKIAEIKRISLEEVAEQTVKSSLKIFNLRSHN